jgi:two-component system OmpR family response regulator
MIMEKNCSLNPQKSRLQPILLKLITFSNIFMAYTVPVLHSRIEGMFFGTYRHIPMHASNPLSKVACIIGRNIKVLSAVKKEIMDYQVNINDTILKALIIDDETDICYLLSRLLKHKNLETAYVNSLSDATDALKAENPEIIFLDNHLPDGLGMNYINFIKSNYPASKIVMITAHDSADDRARAMEQGADLFIGKPFTSDVIYKAVEALV